MNIVGSVKVLPQVLIEDKMIQTREGVITASIPGANAFFLAGPLTARFSERFVHRSLCESTHFSYGF